jgi:hypothetical protein
MTYHFFRGFFGEKTAAWITALWFALLLLVMLMLSAYDEGPFFYLDF